MKTIIIHITTPTSAAIPSTEHKEPVPAEPQRLFIVEGKSGAHLGNCILGSGNTKRAAIIDAYGEGGKLSRGAWIRETDDQDEIERLSRR